MHAARSTDRSGLVSPTVLLTVVAMVCFAANSLLCRLSLAPDLIDPASFTSARVLSAAALLNLVVVLRHRTLSPIARFNARSIASLFGYLIFFSFAYTRLSAGTGALILFAAVQLTMFSIALWEGERFSGWSWFGLLLAMLGLLYLVQPGVTAPDHIGAMSMALSGAAWGLFSLFARGERDPVTANASNFLWCLIPAAMVNLYWIDQAHVSATGLGLAIASGAIASGLGYIVWYFVLSRLTAMRAATVQLSVPAIAALGGALLLGEAITMRLVVASVAMLGGIAIAVMQRTRR